MLLHRELNDAFWLTSAFPVVSRQGLLLDSNADIHAVVWLGPLITRCGR